MIKGLRRACLLLAVAATAGCSTQGQGTSKATPWFINATATGAPSTVTVSSPPATVTLDIYVTTGSPTAYAEGVTVTDLTHGGDPQYVPVTHDGTPYAELNVRPGTYRLTAEVSGQVTCPAKQVDVAAVSEDQENLVCSAT
jgi:hypothetical protein